jgi:hypothetical protein
VRILGEHKRGNYITQYQIKKIPNFWEFEKNLVPPPAISGISKERVAMMWGDVWGMIKRCVGDCVGENKVGRCF